MGEFFFAGDPAVPLVEFEDDIKNTIPDDPSRIAISQNITPDSDQMQLILFTLDRLTNIGHKFRQDGVYVKVSRAENSFDFSIDRLEEGDQIPAIIRNSSESEEINADMFELGNGEIQWSIGVNSSLGGTPVIQSVTYWNDADEGSGNLITSNLNSLPPGS